MWLAVILIFQLTGHCLLELCMSAAAGAVTDDVTVSAAGSYKAEAHGDRDQTAGNSRVWLTCTQRE